MASKQQDTTTLYAPDGRKYEASSPEEITNLKARGYTDTKPKTSTTTSSTSKS